ncbi:MAG: Ribosomal small subunit methyltransferase [Gemmatimonadetes bacterium]|nr:Ribosomal small subunit methyltransferase [Gemmatimonadota bacterium]
MVEREDRAPVGTFHAPGAWQRAERVELDANAAHHAGVKRLVVGDVVRLSSGDGRRALGEIAELSKRRFVVALLDDQIEHALAPPRVELWAPVGDRERMLMLAEKSVELGASVWRPIVYNRSRSVTPRGEGDAFRDKVKLRQIGALEQCGGAWLPEMHSETTLDAALASTGIAGRGSLLLDAHGESFVDVVQSLEMPVRIAMGPEGGLEESERAQFIRAGWRPVSLGANVLRFETAGIAALAIVRSHLR